MSEQAVIQQTFLLGQAFAIMDSVPLFGERTFEFTKDLAEYMTGLKAPCETEPEVMSSGYLAYWKWHAAVATFAAPSLMRQIRLLYPEAKALEKMGGFCTHGDIGTRLEELHRTMNAQGVFFDKELPFYPMDEQEQADAAGYHDSPAHHDWCHKKLLSMRSERLTAEPEMA